MINSGTRTECPHDRGRPYLSPSFIIYNLSFLIFFLGAITFPVFSAQFKFEAQTITIPDGFEVEAVAAPPMVDRPIVADFDDRGFLYVADSSGSNDKMEKQLLDPSHRIVRLEDTNGDGRYDKSVVFADKMMFPEGVMCYRGAVYVGAPPSIWKLEDTNGDGVADRRTEWFQGKVLTGCGNDVHGPYRGRDGRVYWTKGAFAQMNLQIPGRASITNRAAHIFRSRPDGTDLESVMAGGMDNPVEVILTGGGDVLFTTTFYTNPAGGKRDALVHAVYGGIYPKVHDVLDGLIRTGDLMPAMTHLGPAAPSGLAFYESTALGEDFKGNIFSTHFNLHRVQRHRLEVEGSSYRTIDSDFFASDNPDSHPTDVLEDADGSLLILDTGGWYKICCPTSQIAKPEVLGTIYRMRRKGMQLPADPRGLKLAWNEMKASALTRLLDDARPVVRQKAIESLSSHKDSVGALVEVIRKSASVEARVNAVWALTQIEGEKARASVRRAFNDRDPVVRQAAIHSAGLHRDPDAVKELLLAFQHGDARQRRTAATSLGRVGSREATSTLLQAMSPALDRVGEHAIIFALIEIGDVAGLRHGLKSANSSSRRAALIALDQIPGGNLGASEVVPLVQSPEEVVRKTALWIAQRHPDWGKQLRTYFEELLADPKANADSLQEQLSNFSGSEAIHALVVEKLSNSQTAESTRQMLLRVMAQTSSKTTPADWVPVLKKTLELQDTTTLGLAFNAVRNLPGPRSNAFVLSEPLLKLAENESLSEELRLDALNSVPALGKLSDKQFQLLLSRFQTNQPVLQRNTAAGVLTRARLSEEQLDLLTSLVRTSSAFDLGRLFNVYEKYSFEGPGMKLVAALKESPGLKGLRPESVLSRFAKYPASVQEGARELVRQLDGKPDEQKNRLDQLEAALKGGDYRRGHLLFNSSRTACATCHPVGYLGGQVGPDLTRIGAIRTERDLLEAVIFPSASFARGFEPMIVSTRQGEEHAGIIRRETANEVFLISGPTSEERVPRPQIAEIRPGTVSVMPEGLDQQLTPGELSDLIAFLKSLK